MKKKRWLQIQPYNQTSPNPNQGLGYQAMEGREAIMSKSIRIIATILKWFFLLLGIWQVLGVFSSLMFVFDDNIKEAMNLGEPDIAFWMLLTIKVAFGVALFGGYWLLKRKLNKTTEMEDGQPT